MKKSLIATRALTYGTRRLKANDEFEAPRQHARILTAIGRAKYGARAMRAEEFHPLDHDKDGRPGGSVAAETSDELKALRATYQEVMGKRAFPGWDAETLRAKMAEARD